MPVDQSPLPLRDIHLPHSVSWWPPATGYWLVLILIFFIILAIFLFRFWLHRKKIQKSINNELLLLEKDYRATHDVNRLVQGLSVFLRRVCLFYFPQQGCESLTGQKWLQFLDAKTQGKNAFESGPGQVLASAPYSNKADIDADDLLLVCKDWLKSINKTRLKG